MNKNWKYVPFSDIFRWCDKSNIGSTQGKASGKYKLYTSSRTEIKYYDEFIADGESLVFGTGGNPSIHYVTGKFSYTNHCETAQRNKDCVYTKFYFYYFQKDEYAQLNNTFVGGGIKNSSKKKIGSLFVPLPPLPEQERIVARIEEMFSQLDNGVETLKKSKQQLAVYRQAVLKEAFDTALTECNMLSIEKLLTKNRKGMSTGPFGTMIKKSDHKSTGVPMLGIENIGDGRFLDGNKIFVTEEKAQELKSFEVQENDIIISRSGTVGEICVVPKRAAGALLSTNLMRVSLNADIIRSDYFIYLFKSKGIVLDQVKELCKGSTRDFLNQAILKQIVFPVPSLMVQKRIVETISSRLSVCDRIEHTVDAALQQAEALRQSILKKAFEVGI